MTTTTGTGTGTIATPAAVGAPCISYLTVADVRAAFGDDVAEMTDSQITRRIDQLVATLEDALGHTFGRALIASSTAADTLIVTEDTLTVGGDGYAFADYATLGALVAAVNGAGQDYSLELLPQVNPSTPSTYLKTLAATIIGADYEDRAVLCLSALWVQLSGGGTTHLFLPLPLQSVTAVTENATSLTSSYWAIAGENWLTRKCCDCLSDSYCRHPRGRWSNSYPGNIAVAYVPMGWGRAPRSLSTMLLEAFGLQAGVGDGNLQSESFGGAYSYSRRKGSTQGGWQDALGGATVRQYAIKWQP